MAFSIALRRAITKTPTTSPITASSTLISKAINPKPPSPMIATFCKCNHSSSSNNSDDDDDSLDPKKEWCSITGYCDPLNGLHHYCRFPIHKGASDQMGHPFANENSAGLYEIKSIKEGLYVRMDFPGIDKNDVKISFEKNNLIVKGEGEKQSEHDSEGRSYEVSVHLGSPECYNADEIEAYMKNGVLRIVIPRIVKDVSDGE